MSKQVLFTTRWYEMREHLGVLHYAQKYRWDVYSSHHMPDAVFKVPDLDGLIVEFGPKDRTRIEMARRFKGPIVALEDYGSGLHVPRVHADNHAIGRMAAQHFIERGFTRFMTLCRANHRYVHQRIAGFHEGIESAEQNECLDIRLNRKRQPIYSNNGTHKPKSFDKILTTLKGPVGVFCVDDDDATELIRQLLQEGISVPEQVAVVGVNNDPLVCPFARVPISSIDPDFEAIGYRAAQLLNRMMRGEKVEPKTYCVQPKGIVVRRSSDIRAVEDVQVAKAIRFIWDHSTQWRSINHIAEHVGLATRTLQWRFKKVMGYSLQDEMIRSRIDRIKDELIQTDKPIRQIADEMDFSSVQYLIRLFSKQTGISPLKYRREHKQMAG